MSVINELLSLVMALKVPSPYFEVLAVVIVLFAFWYTFESILTKRLENQDKSLDNQKKRLGNKLLEKQLSQPVNEALTPSAPTPGGETNL
ncbi:MULTISPECIES: hypothetical protein [Bacillus cereus group]|uniref:hypothetical protein n=1 Tax=Bacillus cereus group TaxID=86661 RepID=UPI000BEF2146|nr:MULTISPECIES: hypothetical protein [Bacillus cereus group]PEO40091.1 hypothetical protein CN555_05760 [Bacillus wiedmannii]QWH76406.1 hypothetical protein EXW59_06685 [Bacillus mycoides]QWI46686.1 hypothetical protein EXW55_28550 [Bacillus mycoides]